MKQTTRRTNCGSIRWALAAGLGLIAALNTGTPAAYAKSVKDELLELTGGKRAKVVWNQGDKVRLFDTKDGAIQDLPMPIGSAPLLSRDGRRVFISTGKAPEDRQVMMYDTETKKVTEFPKGPGNNLLAVWQDPKTGREWVYVNGTGDQGENWDQAKGGAIHRFPVDKPDARELFWDRTTSHLYLMFSADGTRACFEPSWANIGQLKLAFDAQGKVDQEKSEYTQFGAGCFPSMAPDNSYRLFRLEGDHKSIAMHDTDNTSSWKVNTSEMVGGRANWLTRWSAHPRYITLMGPDSNEARIWIGRFSEDFKTVEAWVQVNDDGPKCMQSHSWVESEAEAVAKPVAPVARRPAVAPPREWPRATGPVFALRNGKTTTPVVAFDTKGRDLMAFNCSPRGRAVIGRFFELVCDGGSFHAQEAGAWVGQQVARSGAFTIEATITPAQAAPQNAGVVFALANDEGEDFALVQDKAGLSLRLRGGESISLFAPEAGKPVHVLITCDKTRYAAYRNGRSVSAGMLTANPAAWAPRELVMGAAWSGAEPWRGRMEMVAVYPRALSNAEAVGQTLAVNEQLVGRKPASTVRFKGTLTRQAKTSALEDIRPYTRSLTAAEYKVDQVLAGEWKEPTITVLHWMIMDAKRLPIADRKPGTKVELSVSPLEENPQLESDRRDEELDGEIPAELFYCESEAAP